MTNAQPVAITKTTITSVGSVTLRDVERFCEMAREQGAEGKERVTCLGGDALQMILARQ